ncbi:probable RNA helicase SDE3 isoform X2 [Pyrus communis]|uniref:probable RNA helicase SDE3 isoform X2 n=1 Tax=Pyrus communis TaxID=23211 RepID=UPI0035C14394
MSIFCDLLRCLLCCDDEHDNAYHSLSQFPAQTASNKRDYYYETSNRNTSQPFTSFTPAASPLKPPSTQYNHVLSPFSSSSSSPNPKPASSLSKLNTSSLSPKSPQSFSFESYSTSLATPTSSTKLPQSTFVHSYNSSKSPLNPPTSSFKLSQSFSSSSASPPIPSSSSSTFYTRTSNIVSSSKAPQASSRPNSSSPKPPTSSPKPPSSSCTPTASSKPSSSSSFTSSSPNPPTYSFKPKKSSLLNASSQFSPKLSTSASNPPPASASKPCPSSSTGPPVSSTKLRPMFKPALSHASSDVLDQMGKKSYVWVEKDSLPIFAIPDNIKDLIKNDIAPKVLNQPLSPVTYKDYFSALLYAEEFFYEKWPHFDLENVTVELQRAAVFKKPDRVEKTFVAFDMASFPENPPFLLSRDLVHVRPSGTNAEPFQGFIYRVVKSSVVLVEFEDDFYVHHYSTRKYDVSFSFNRVCLKRAHQAVQNASDALFRNFLFPESVLRTNIPTAPALLCTDHKLDLNQLSAVRHILGIRGSPPYLLAGQLCVEKSRFEKSGFRLSRTGVVISEAVYQLCQTSHGNRILICAPSNRCCDQLMRSLLKWIPESDMFRANAAFREKEEVPKDILPSCLYEETCFSCPPTEELCEFRVISSTFMSSFRLHDKGLTAGHFSHIFLVDASSAIEPETLVALTSFGDKNTTVIVTGEAGDRSRWVRADIARKKGLKISFFERLSKLGP